MIHHRSGFFRMIYSHPITIVFNSIQFFDWWSEFNLLYTTTIITMSSISHHYRCFLSSRMMITQIIPIIIIIMNLAQQSMVYAKPNYPLLRGVTFRVSFFFVLIVYLKISSFKSLLRSQTNKKTGNFLFYSNVRPPYIYNNYDLTEQFYL